MSKSVLTGRCGRLTPIVWAVAAGLVFPACDPCAPPPDPDANERAAIESLKTVVFAQARYRDEDRDGNGRPDYAASLADLGAESLIDADLASGTRQGYVFRMTPTALGWSVTATPLDAAHGMRRFFADWTGVLRFTVDQTRDASELDQAFMTADD